jgi:hypothetical protein
MSYYKHLTDQDKVSDVAIVTSGLFQDGASSITTFHTSSTQYTNTGDYNIDLYRYAPGTNASASVQFGVVFGDRDGSGSLGGVGVSGDRPTAAIFGQFNNFLNPPETTQFTFGDLSTKEFYGVVFNRARLRERMEAGGWELHLKNGATGPVVKLIDDSSTNKGGNTGQRNFAPEYNIVSGTLVGGTDIDTAAASEGATGTYGKFYPSVGVLILNPTKLADPSNLNLVTVSGSNSDDRNNEKLYNVIKTGAYFQAKREEQITSRHFFVRATANEFNATTNETFYTESVAGVKRIVDGLSSDPKTYITSVGMYNADNELLAIAKLSQPILKSKSREALIKVKLDF